MRCTSVKELLHLLDAVHDPVPVQFDLQLAAYLNDSSGRQDVRALAAAFDLGSVSGEPGSKEYLAASALLLGELHNRLESSLKAADLWSLYRDLELPLAYLLAAMEHTGILVDRGKLERLGEELDRHSTQIAEQIYTEAGEKFNINSPKQLGVILYDKLGLPVLKRTKTGPSTSAEVLEQLSAYPIVSLVLEYRQVEKLRSTYADALVQLISPETGRIHTTFHQTVTARPAVQLKSKPAEYSGAHQRRRQIRKLCPTGQRTMSADYPRSSLGPGPYLSRRSADGSFVGKDIHTQTASRSVWRSHDQVSKSSAVPPRPSISDRMVSQLWPGKGINSPG